MNAANLCHLEGTVVGECWTRYSPRKRGQVRFWLSVVGDQGAEILLCAIEPPAMVDVPAIEAAIQGGRHVKLDAAARRVDLNNPFAERMAVVIFVAESCTYGGGFELATAEPASTPRRHAAHGKMAAAGDDAGEWQHADSRDDAGRAVVVNLGDGILVKDTPERLEELGLLDQEDGS